MEAKFGKTINFIQLNQWFEILHLVKRKWNSRYNQSLRYTEFEAIPKSEIAHTKLTHRRVLFSANNNFRSSSPSVSPRCAMHTRVHAHAGYTLHAQLSSLLSPGDSRAILKRASFSAIIYARRAIISWALGAFVYNTDIAPIYTYAHRSRARNCSPRARGHTHRERLRTACIIQLQERGKSRAWAKIFLARVLISLWPPGPNLARHSPVAFLNLYVYIRNVCSGRRRWDD